MATDTETIEPASDASLLDTGQSKGRNRRKSLALAHRELNDEELASPAVQKLLLDEIDRLENENIALKSYQSDFYLTDKKLAILEQKNKQTLSFEILSLTCTTIGAACIGYSRAIWSDTPTAAIFISIGVALIVGGIIAKAKRS